MRVQCLHALTAFVDASDFNIFALYSPCRFELVSFESEVVVVNGETHRMVGMTAESAHPLRQKT